MNTNEVAALTLDIAFSIHREYGPGLLESVYEELFCYELDMHGLRFERQVRINLERGEKILGLAFRADLIIEKKIIVELKSIDELADVHFKQLLTYLKISKLELGLLINFNESLLKNGIKRVVNNLRS